jgi:hypothetical protein
MPATVGEPAVLGIQPSPESVRSCLRVTFLTGVPPDMRQGHHPLGVEHRGRQGAGHASAGAVQLAPLQGNRRVGRGWLPNP